jgi:hypothetical protein
MSGVRTVALLLLATMAAATPAPALEPVRGTELAARIGGDGFEFRGRTQVWRFAPDGRISSESTITRIVLGGIFEQFGIKGAGTWRRDGDQLCIRWREPYPRGEECYDVKRSQGRFVHLIGPGIIEGTLEPLRGTAEAGRR